MNLILLQLITIASNITAVVSICFRLFSTNNLKINGLITALPLIKQDVWNLTINIILILYTIGTMIVVVKLFTYHIEILLKNLTTYQDIKLSSLDIEEKKLPYFFLTRNESILNFESKSKYFFFLFKKKVLFRIKKVFFIPYEYYKNESNENIEFLQTAVAVINKNQKDIGNNYNPVPSSALSNEIFDVKANGINTNKILTEDKRERISENTKEKNLNVNFPCNQIKELITNNYNFNSNSNSYSNSEINTKNNNKIISTVNNNTKSVSLSQSNSKDIAPLINNNDENLIKIENFEIKNTNNDNQIKKGDIIKLDYIFKKTPNNNQRISKNMQKRMNQYLLNHNILNFENIFRDNSINKDKNNIGSLHSINRQNFSSYNSSNLNENNINLGEIHLSEREKNNLNHVLNEINYNNFNNNRNQNNHDNLIQRYLFNNNSNKTKPSPESFQKNKNKSLHNINNHNNLKNFNLAESVILSSNYNDLDKNKNVPRHFRINSNIDNLNQKNRKIDSRKIVDSITQSNFINDNYIDSNRRELLENIGNNYELPYKNSKERFNENRETSNLRKEKLINDIENDSKKSLNEKIISIINSSGTVDDIDISENGIYNI
jgi:hypothetical protein